jgi:DNA-binding GntR family transcriptional regulator
MTPIVKEGLRDIVYKQLHEMVESSRFIPGARINVEELTVEMGVSRTPIWQAISKLEKEGLLKSIPNKGVFVETFSPEALIDLFSVREVLECLAARLSAQHIQEEIIVQLEQNLAKQQEVISERDMGGFSRLDTEFHETIYQTSGNSFLIEILNDIKKKLRPAVVHMDIILAELYRDHQELLNALRSRDADRAQNAFITHNERKKKVIQEFIKSNQ